MRLRCFALLNLLVVPPALLPAQKSVSLYAQAGGAVANADDPSSQLVSFAQLGVSASRGRRLSAFVDGSGIGRFNAARCVLGSGPCTTDEISIRAIFAGLSPTLGTSSFSSRISFPIAAGLVQLRSSTLGNENRFGARIGGEILMLETKNIEVSAALSVIGVPRTRRGDLWILPFAIGVRAFYQQTGRRTGDGRAQSPLLRDSS